MLVVRKNMTPVTILQLVMLLWSYFAVVFTDAGSVPPNWRPVLDEESGDSDPLTGSEFSAMPADATNPMVRYCRKCNQLKPPRCHHCSVCESYIQVFTRLISFSHGFKLDFVIVSGGRCVLKMDHHCVWVVNCVGALNYKYFLLFLV